jgi:thiamine biosynthesis lipoprotein
MWTFPAMGTEVTVALPDRREAEARALVEAIAVIFRDNEERFSRFRHDSELSILNRSRGPTTVSREMFDALLEARAFHELTSGLFDPAVGAALVRMGYDRSFAPGAMDRADVVRPRRTASLAEVVLEPETRTVFRPDDVQLDLGGIVKGRTVDEAAELLPGAGAVDAGGDAVLRGCGDDAGGWLVEVEDPARPERPLLLLRLRDRAVATSAPNRRRWRAGGTEAHHLVDPRTNRSAESDLAQVTVVAPNARTADVLAKTGFLLGAAAARAWLSGLSDVAAILVRRDASIEIVGSVEVLDA